MSDNNTKQNESTNAGSTVAAQPNTASTSKPSNAGSTANTDRNPPPPRLISIRDNDQGRNPLPPPLRTTFENGPKEKK